LHLQVLGAVLPYVRDVGTLLVCSALSKQAQQLVQDAVRHSLAPLVEQLCEPPNSLAEPVSRGRARRWCYNIKKQLQWLWDTAGPAVINSHSNTCAILLALDNMPASALKVDAKHKCKQQQSAA
jgi:hypothetical protein